MPPSPPANYLAGYPPELVEQICQLIKAQRLAGILLKKYPAAHQVRTDRALYDYVLEIKNETMRHAGQVSKVAYDSTLHILHNALGTHTSIARRQGSKLKSKQEIRVASLFRETPPAFLRMIVVHELAHLKEAAHNKAFYALCRHMEPDYHQVELDLRAYLSYLAAGGSALWGAGDGGQSPSG